MSNTTPAKFLSRRRRLSVTATTLCLNAAMIFSHASAHAQEPNTMNQVNTAVSTSSETLTVRQQAIVPIAAFAAAGDIAKLNLALNQGLDSGLTVSETKEILVQVYAYAGFPRSLNALAEFMKVLEARKAKGVQDDPGLAPSHAIATADALLAAGTANQTKLAGAPVKGPLFDFAPAIDQYLKTHLFGDIFERDNLDWQSRELATLGMLSALSGAESQLQSHMNISLNTGLAPGQLRQVAQVLGDRVDADYARRAREALERQLAAKGGSK